jgi:glutamate synthase domain-containing protein 3
VSHALNARGRDLRSASSELKSQLASGHVTVRNARRIDGLCAGLKSGEVTIEGDSGDYLGALNDGATIEVSGNAGRYLADNMTKGTVLVRGDAGDGVGAYCYGGMIVIKGSAGNFTAVMNKGATIIVGGDVGDEVATYMLAGDVVIVGNAGRNLGNYLIRGSIYVGGEWTSLGHNTRVEEMTDADATKLGFWLSSHSIEADPSRFRKIVRLSEKPFYKSKPPKTDSLGEPK